MHPYIYIYILGYITCKGTHLTGWFVTLISEDVITLSLLIFKVMSMIYLTEDTKYDMMRTCFSSGVHSLLFVSPKGIYLSRGRLGGFISGP